MPSSVAGLKPGFARSSSCLLLGPTALLAHEIGFGSKVTTHPGAKDKMLNGSKCAPYFPWEIFETYLEESTVMRGLLGNSLPVRCPLPSVCFSQLVLTQAGAGRVPVCVEAPGP